MKLYSTTIEILPNNTVSMYLFSYERFCVAVLILYIMEVRARVKREGATVRMRVQSYRQRVPSLLIITFALTPEMGNSNSEVGVNSRVGDFFNGVGVEFNRNGAGLERDLRIYGVELEWSCCLLATLAQVHFML